MQTYLMIKQNRSLKAQLGDTATNSYKLIRNLVSYTLYLSTCILDYLTKKNIHDYREEISLYLRKCRPKTGQQSWQSKIVENSAY